MEWTSPKHPIYFTAPQGGGSNDLTSDVLPASGWASWGVPSPSASWQPLTNSFFAGVGVKSPPAVTQRPSFATSFSARIHALDTEESEARERIHARSFPERAFLVGAVRDRASLWSPLLTHHAEMIARACIEEGCPDVLEWLLARHSASIGCPLPNALLEAQNSLPGTDRQLRLECVFLIRQYYPSTDTAVEAFFRTCSAPSYMISRVLPPWSYDIHHEFPSTHRGRCRAILRVPGLLMQVIAYLPPLFSAAPPLAVTPPRQILRAVNYSAARSLDTVQTPTPGHASTPGSAHCTETDTDPVQHLVIIAVSKERIWFRYPILDGTQTRVFDISGSATKRFGLYHGQRIRKSYGDQGAVSGTIVGVGQDHALWWQRDGENVAVRLALIPEHITRLGTPKVIGAALLREAL